MDYRRSGYEDRKIFKIMKRILLITEGLGSGGAERQICGLAAMLTKVGYPCRLITYVENQFYEPYLRQNEVDYEFEPELWNKNTRVFRVAKYVRLHKPDVDISFLFFFKKNYFQYFYSRGYCPCNVSWVFYVLEYSSERRN